MALLRCALVVASGAYALIAAMSSQLGFGAARHTAGFIASVLFLFPGFPLVAALLDLLEHQTLVYTVTYAVGNTLLMIWGMVIVMLLT